jgi:hypothetical protein
MMQRATREPNIFKFFKNYASCNHYLLLLILKVYYYIIVFQKKKLLVHFEFLNVGRDLHLIHNYFTITKGLFLIFWDLYNFITQLNQKFSTIFSISEYGITKSMKTCYICGFINAIFGDNFRWYKCRLVSNPWAWWLPRILLCTLEFFSRNSCTATTLSSET